ncbi:hypothetical protein HDU97_003403 [Phlyctochytrium planicorne]|nr:hypothetical protein HDU97_003403 [Phlyctochytrium planicorne]
MASQVVSSKAIDSLHLLAKGLIPTARGKNDVNDLIAALLFSHFFDITKMEGILFNMVGLVLSGDPSKELDTSDKAVIYEDARAPVRILEAQYKKAERAPDSVEPPGRKDERAARDIFERSNSSGGMGQISNDRWELYVDLHGLHVEEAKLMMEQFVLPVVPVLKSVNIITGRGKHSQSGESILKKAMKDYLPTVGFVGKEVQENPGVLNVVALG